MKQEENCSPEHGHCGARLAAIEDALYAIGGKWKLRIIITLFEGKKRFNEIQRTIGSISPKVLSHELKELELNGFVKRNVFSASMPVVVEYEVTEYSATLKKVLEALVEWGTTHKEKVKEIPTAR